MIKWEEFTRYKILREDDSRGGAEGAEKRNIVMQIDEITGIIIDTALEIHKELGPGLLESVYEVVLAKMLTERGLSVQQQKPVNFKFHEIRFEEGFRCDLLVENSVVVELKSVEKIAHVHQKQLQTYLRLMEKEVGLLINFGAATLKEGLQRIVNNYSPSASTLLRVNRSGDKNVRS